MATDYKKKYQEAQAQSDRNFARYEKRKAQSDKNFARYEREKERANKNEEVVDSLKVQVSVLQTELDKLKIKLKSNSTIKPHVDSRTSLAILGLSTGFTNQDLKESYARLVNRYHPDKHIHMPTDFIATAEAEFKKIKSAYEKLK